jgi:fructoselysine 6-kinase
VTDRSVLLGPISVDRWVDEGRDLPGGGALNMAYHWSKLALPFTFVSRIGHDDAAVVLAFLERHRITTLPSLVADGRSATIDVRIGDDRQPWMDHFVPGVWDDFALTADERDQAAAAARLHAVLVDPVVDEMERLHADGVLRRTAVSADLLSFRHYDVERFVATMRWVELAFIGWPGRADDTTLDRLRDIAFELGRLVVVTLGSAGMRVLDGRSHRDERVPVDAVDVEGTTVGCGDAFIAGFLASWWRGGSLDASLQLGAANGAAATRWWRPLPDAAY